MKQHWGLKVFQNHLQNRKATEKYKNKFRWLKIRYSCRLKKSVKARMMNN